MPPEYTKVYGKGGDTWNRGRNPQLLDYSYVGNLDPIDITHIHTINVRDFGAKGDGKTDDTQAFKDAIKASKAMIYIPDGMYNIRDRLQITKPTVLKGESQQGTIINFPDTLTDLFGNNATGRSKWAFGHEFLTFGDPKYKLKPPLAKIIQHKNKGNSALPCDNVSKLKRGQWIKIRMSRGIDNAIDNLLYANSSLVPTDSRSMGEVVIVNQIRTINTETNTVSLVYPLVMSLPESLNPTIYSHDSQVYAIQDLTFKGKGGKYPGHFNEVGNNYIHFNNVHKGWIKNVIFENADIALKLNNCLSNNLDNLTFKGRMGHHGLWIIGGGYNLTSNFQVENNFVHDISVEKTTVNNVFHRGSGENLNIDCHRHGPYGTLVTNVNIGKGTRYYNSGGAKHRGAHSGAHNTFWGIMTNLCQVYSQNCALLELPRDHRGNSYPAFGWHQTLVGTFRQSKKSTSEQYVESFDHNMFYPRDIYEDMKEHHLRPIYNFKDFEFSEPDSPSTPQEPHTCPEPEPHTCPEPEPHTCPEPEPHTCPEPEPHTCPEPEPHTCPEPEPHVCPEPAALECPKCPDCKTELDPLPAPPLSRPKTVAKLQAQPRETKPTTSNQTTIAAAGGVVFISAGLVILVSLLVASALVIVSRQ